MIDALDEGPHCTPRNGEEQLRPWHRPLPRLRVARPGHHAGPSSNPALLAPTSDRTAAPPVHCVGGQCVGCGHCVSKRTDTVRGVRRRGRAGRAADRVARLRGVPEDLAKLIDHTLLRPDATYADIDKLCDEAKRYGFASVCVNPVHVKRCAHRLRGASLSCVRSSASRSGPRRRSQGARGAARHPRRRARGGHGHRDRRAQDRRPPLRVRRHPRRRRGRARRAGHPQGRSSRRRCSTDEEKVAACVAAKRARADFVKTSTGFSKGGATAHDVR